MLPRGRPPVVFRMEVERELTNEDLFRFQVMNDQPLQSAPIIQRLREVHQRAARLVAAGKSHVEVGIETGRSAQRIGDLCRDPAFKELVEYYRTQIEEVEIVSAAIAFRDYADINDLARGEILGRLEDPTKIKDVPIDELRRLMTDTGDRTHMPPKTAAPIVSIPTKITFNMGKRDIRPKDENGILIEHDEHDEHDDVNGNLEVEFEQQDRKLDGE